MFASALGISSDLRITPVWKQEAGSGSATSAECTETRELHEWSITKELVVQ